MTAQAAQRRSSCKGPASSAAGAQDRQRQEVGRSADQQRLRLVADGLRGLPRPLTRRPPSCVARALPHLRLRVDLYPVEHGLPHLRRGLHALVEGGPCQLGQHAEGARADPSGSDLVVQDQSHLPEVVAHAFLGDLHARLIVDHDVNLAPDDEKHLAADLALLHDHVPRGEHCELEGADHRHHHGRRNLLEERSREDKLLKQE
mmetsp:Transcript_80673/g.202981  ORF Transcript_80673/g.202981 Transcript_80673/m.202981 type:complete len:203 (-) Transcript_80673:721-1329(-)